MAKIDVVHHFSEVIPSHYLRCAPGSFVALEILCGSVKGGGLAQLHDVRCSKLREDVQYRKEVAEQVGLGFELSANNADVVPNVPSSQPAAATANAM